MALIDVVKWDGSADELVWKFPNSELSTMTQLIVNESQAAILFKDGKRMDVFAAGRHTLSTNNIPLLNKLVNLPFGGTSPFAAEVWFVNQAVPLDLKWGTPTPMQLEDPQYGLVVPVSAFGQMGVRIQDPGKFVSTVVGTVRTFTTRAVMEYFKGVLVAQLKASIVKAIVKRQTPILQIEAELVTLSEEIQTDIAPHYERFGLEVQLFRIMSISVPENDPGVLELKKAKAAAARRKIEGTNYAQERTFDVMGAQASNPGMGGVAANLGAGLAMGQMMGAMAGQQMQQGMGAQARSGPHPDLLRFIEVIVEDGVITDKEREILRRKAQELGTDPDEAEIIADSKLHAMNRDRPRVSAPPPSGGFGAAVPSFAYHVQFNGQNVGPVPFEQMRQAAGNGQLVASTPVWRNGLAGWQPASSLPELGALFAPAGPPPFGGFGGGGPPAFGGG